MGSTPGLALICFCRMFSPRLSTRPSTESERHKRRLRPRSAVRLLKLEGLTDMKQLSQGSSLLFQGIIAVGRSVSSFSAHPWIPHSPQKPGTWTSPWMTLLHNTLTWDRNTTVVNSCEHLSETRCCSMFLLRLQSEVVPYSAQEMKKYPAAF